MKMKKIPLDQMESRNLLELCLEFPTVSAFDCLRQPDHFRQLRRLGMSKEDAQKKAQALLDRLGLGALEMLILTLFLGTKTTCCICACYDD